jgi:hypothetical protein
MVDDASQPIFIPLYIYTYIYIYIPLSWVPSIVRESQLLQVLQLDAGGDGDEKFLELGGRDIPRSEVL